MVAKKKPAKKPVAKKVAAVKPGTSKASAETRRRIFVNEFVANGGNATQAAISAGFSEKTARQQGARLLSDVAVSGEITRRRNELAEKHHLKADDTIAELAKIVRADLRKIFNEDGSMKAPKDWPDEIAGAISSIEVDEIGIEGVVVGRTKKIKLWDKNSAIEKAMKHLGQFEADNKQRGGLLADLPREVLTAIRDRLQQLNNGKQ